MWADRLAQSGRSFRLCGFLQNRASNLGAPCGCAMFFGRPQGARAGGARQSRRSAACRSRILLCSPTSHGRKPCITAIRAQIWGARLQDPAQPCELTRARRSGPAKLGSARPGSASLPYIRCARLCRICHASQKRGGADKGACRVLSAPPRTSQGRREGLPMRLRVLSPRRQRSR